MGPAATRGECSLVGRCGVVIGPEVDRTTGGWDRDDDMMTNQESYQSTRTATG